MLWSSLHGAAATTPTHMVSPQRISALTGTFHGDCMNEQTPFVTSMAVIVITSAIRSKGMSDFRLVTRATSQSQEWLRNGQIMNADHKDTEYCGFLPVEPQS